MLPLTGGSSGLVIDVCLGGWLGVEGLLTGICTGGAVGEWLLVKRSRDTGPGGSRTEVWVRDVIDVYGRFVPGVHKRDGADW